MSGGVVTAADLSTYLSTWSAAGLDGDNPSGFLAVTILDRCGVSAWAWWLLTVAPVVVVGRYTEAEIGEARRLVVAVLSVGEA